MRFIFSVATNFMVRNLTHVWKNRYSVQLITIIKIILLLESITILAFYWSSDLGLLRDNHQNDSKLFLSKLPMKNLAILKKMLFLKPGKKQKMNT